MSCRGIRIFFTSRSLSSTPSFTGACPPASSLKPPAWMMVYFILFFLPRKVSSGELQFVEKFLSQSNCSGAWRIWTNLMGKSTRLECWKSVKQLMTSYDQLTLNSNRWPKQFVWVNSQTSHNLVCYVYRVYRYQLYKGSYVPQTRNVQHHQNLLSRSRPGMPCFATTPVIAWIEKKNPKVESAKFLVGKISYMPRRKLHKRTIKERQKIYSTNSFSAKGRLQRSMR